MPAVLVVAAATGASAAIGMGVAAAVGMGTIGAVAATAIGTGIIAGTMTAAQGGSTSDVLKSAVLSGATAYVGGTIGQALSGGASGVSNITDAQFAAADAAQLAGQGLSESAITQNLIGAGVDPSIAASLASQAIEGATADAMAAALGSTNVFTPSYADTIRAQFESGAIDANTAMSDLILNQDMSIADAAGRLGITEGSSYLNPVTDIMQAQAGDFIKLANGNTMTLPENWTPQADGTFVSSDGSIYNADGYYAGHVNVGEVVRVDPATGIGYSADDIAVAQYNLSDAATRQALGLDNITGMQDAYMMRGDEVIWNGQVDAATGQYYDMYGNPVNNPWNADTGMTMVGETGQVLQSDALLARESMIPVQDASGNTGYFDPATGNVYDANMQIQPQAPVAATPPPTQVASSEPFRLEVSGVAHTAEAPPPVGTSLPTNTQLATQAQVEAGQAAWDAGSSSWTVPQAELSPVIPTVVEPAVSAVAPVVVPPSVPVVTPPVLETAGAAIGAAAGGGAWTPLPVAGPVTPAEAAVGGVPTPVTPAPVAPAPAPVIETPAPVTSTAPVAPTPVTSTAPTTEQLGAAAGTAVAPIAGAPSGMTVQGAIPGTPGSGLPAETGAPLTPVTPAPGTVPPVVDATPVPVTPPAPIAPPEVPPGSVPVVDATPTPVAPGTPQLPGSIPSGGLSASDLALLAAGYTIVNGVLTPPALNIPTVTAGNYTWGSADKLVNPGVNPGYLMGGVVRPQIAGATPTQTQYYWGGRPLITDTAKLGTWNTAIPTTQPYGVAYAAGTGTNQMNLQETVNAVLGRGQALSGYPAATTPVAPT